MSSDRQIIAANELAWRRWTNTGPTSPVPTWLAARGLDPQRVQRAGWEPGWAPDDWSALRTVLARHNVPTQVAIDAGLLRRRDGGGTYDGFRGRIMLPVRSIINGDILGFIGRWAGPPQPETPKYLNSPSNAAHRKGNVVIGGYEARRRLTEDRAAITGLVVCEGPVDVLNLSTTASWVAVAPGGTAMTPAQADWIAALTNVFEVPLLLAYDGDQPGQQAAGKAAALLRDRVAQLRIAELPQDRDPADMSRTELDNVLSESTGRGR